MHFRADPDCIKYGDTKKVKWVLKKYEPEEYTVPICSHLGCDTPCPPGEHRSEQPDGSFLCHICNVATQNGITQRICQHCNMKTGNSAVPCPDASAGNIVYDCKGCYAKQHVIFCNDCGRECIGTENKRKVFDEDGQQLIGRFHCQACWGYYRNKKTRVSGFVSLAVAAELYAAHLQASCLLWLLWDHRSKSCLFRVLRWCVNSMCRLRLRAG